MCEYEPLKRRVESIVGLAMSIVTPLAGNGSLSVGATSSDEHRSKAPKSEE